MAAKRRAKKIKKEQLPEIQVEIEINGVAEDRHGPDLNEAARAALRKFASEQGLEKTVDLAKRVGIRAPSLAMLLAGDQGMRVDVLSRVCAALDMSPALFFESGGAYERQGKADADSALMDHFRRIIPRHAQVQLFEMMLLAQATGYTAEALEVSLSMVRHIATREGVDRAAILKAAESLADKV